MSRIAVSGFGAVSPAGWGLGALRAALAHGKPVPPRAVARPGWTRPLWVCEVPPVQQPPPFLAHRRLRRASPLTHYVCAAGLEALEAGGANANPSSGRLGLIVCLLCGAVRYSNRFFEETLLDPATASPVLFPETVFNAPASHLTAVLGREPLCCTLIGEPGTFLQAVALGAEWLDDGLVDGCLVIGAEETNWLLADVLWHFDHGAVLAGGAGALYLTRLSAPTRGVELSMVTDPLLYSTGRSRAAAALAMRRLLPISAPDELLCDSAKNRPRADAAEARLAALAGDAP
jgi:3-oxoacyl-(acyl-carrier-protein) synthase